MKIEHQRVGSVDVISPVGALVDADATTFSKQLLQRVQSTNVRVVVSLREVPYLDSVALEGLLDASDELSKRAEKLKLTNVSQTCREIFELTNMTGHFRFFLENQDAVKSFL